MEFRVDFFFRVGMDVLWNVTHVVFFTVLFMHTEMLGDLNYDQMLVFPTTRPTSAHGSQAARTRQTAAERR